MEFFPNPPSSPSSYAELHCLSNFSFLRGASHPEELVQRAAELGYSALALTDECSLAGAVRAHTAAKQHAIKLILGSEIRLADGPCLVLLAMNREGYGNLSGLITRGRRNAGKGSYVLNRDSLQQGLEGCIALLIADAGTTPEQARWLAGAFPGNAWLAVEFHRQAHDARVLEKLTRLGQETGLPLVAAGDVHMHRRGRRALQDLLTAIRLNTPLRKLGHALYPNGERHLRPLPQLTRIYPRALLEETVRIAGRCRFSLDELRYNYPHDVVPEGETPTAYLRRLTEQGMRGHWPGGAPRKVRDLVEHELAIIAELGYEPYFLAVHDIVSFARGRGILCQGRGSAANSAVCFCLGITAVDPSRMEMLFERFVSKERNEPPDIDVDFEHHRREEVFQYIYAKYGRERTALTATVICYRTKSALRDVGKALELDLDQIERLGSAFDWGSRAVQPDRIREAGFDPENPQVMRLLTLVQILRGFPRHLSQHVGGFVITRDYLSRLVPIENAAMPDRTVIQWDKDDLDAMGMLKVDCLALGMLTAIQRTFALLRHHEGKDLNLTRIPPEDPGVYRMIQQADTVGVFQIESRAQMAMLPRLRPRTFYDLVVEVAIVRPGPIQGKMVHPYLRRRQGMEPITYPSDAVKGILKRTLGIPIFQEQVIKLAMVAAGFTAGEADQLRRAMAAWRRRGDLREFEQRLRTGMAARGYSEEFAGQILAQIQGFGEYGFPESHAASFALLVYTSAWLKHHHPAPFTCALLNSQPMGFYAPSQLLQDVRRHGVEVRPVDVRHSDWDCTLEDVADPGNEHSHAIRLGLRMVKGLSSAPAGRLVEARNRQPFQNMQDLCQRVRLNRSDLEALTAAGAMTGWIGHRYETRWEALGTERPMPLFESLADQEPRPALAAPSEADDLIADYASLGFTLGRHPLALLRNELGKRRLASAADIRDMKNGCSVRTAGLVITRQRPGSAGGVVFVTLEDETGVSNIIVWEQLAEQQRKELLGARLLGISGKVQREGDVIHIVARRLHDYSRLLGSLNTHSRDFH